MTITDTPYLYYVRSDVNHGPYQRVLFRQKIKVELVIEDTKSMSGFGGHLDQISIDANRPKHSSS